MMRIIKLTALDGHALYAVAAHVVAFCRMSDAFLKSVNVDADLTVVVMASRFGGSDSDLWVTESPEEIKRLLTEEE